MTEPLIIWPCDPNVPDGAEPRLAGQTGIMLTALKPRYMLSNAELRDASGSMKHTSRISDARAKGFEIVMIMDANSVETGIHYYSLKGWDPASKLQLSSGAEAVVVQLKMLINDYATAGLRANDEGRSEIAAVYDNVVQDLSKLVESCGSRSWEPIKADPIANPIDAAKVSRKGNLYCIFVATKQGWWRRAWGESINEAYEDVKSYVEAAWKLSCPPLQSFT